MSFDVRRLACRGATILLILGAAPLAAQLPAPAVSSPHAVHLAGYGGVVFGYSPQNPSEDRTAFPAATAAVLLSGTVLPRLSYFGDFQAASWTDENWTGVREENNFNVARLYAEYAFSDAFRLRLGRFLTPVGQWNEIPAEPLTWTVLRPLTTYRPFAKSTTGVLVAGTVPLAGHDAGYAFYLAPPDWSREEAQESGFVQATGGRVAVELTPGLVLGASAARFRVSRPYQPEDAEYGEAGLPSDSTDSPAEETREAEAESRFLFGADLSWDVGRVELLSEVAALSRTSLRPGERGGYVQAAIRVLGPARLVLRSEAYDPVYASAVAVQTIGVATRIFQHVTFKLERQISNHPSERVRDGWFVSLSALF